MSRVYVTATVPAAARDAAEALLAGYLASPTAGGCHLFSVPLVPLAGPSDAPPTAYGLCAPVPDDGLLYAALPALTTAVAGASYRTVAPWRSFDPATDWSGWLAAGGLRPRREAAAERFPTPTPPTPTRTDR